MAPHVVHVEVSDRADDLVECRRWQRAGLGVDQDAVAERHQGGDRGHVGGARQAALLLGVDRPEDEIGVGFRRGLVGWGKLPARAAPARPEVDEEDAAVLDRLVEVLLGQLDGGHASQGTTRPNNPGVTTQYAASLDTEACSW